MTDAHFRAVVNGSLGYQETRARYGDAQMDRWRRMGGRKPNPTLAEIEAGIARPRKRPKRVSPGRTSASAREAGQGANPPGQLTTTD